jgi:hypothetical protein
MNEYLELPKLQAPVIHSKLGYGVRAYTSIREPLRPRWPGFIIEMLSQTQFWKADSSADFFNKSREPRKEDGLSLSLPKAARHHICSSAPYGPWSFRMSSPSVSIFRPMKILSGAGVTFPHTYVAKFKPDKAIGLGK